MLVQPWRIEMLGGLRVSRGEQTITRFRTQKDAALLAYLAYYPEKPHVRDDLIEMLWPGGDLQAARNRMRVGLNALRHQLEPPGTQSGAVLEGGRLTLRLRPEAFTSDVAAFKAAIAAAQQAEDEADRVRSLVIAADTYAGDLLPNFFEEWVLSEREPLAQSHLQALHRLTRIMARAKDYEVALTYARRAAQSDPMREEAHRDVMSLCVAIGQPSAALQQYEELKRLLADSVGSAPSKATQQLARQIADNVGRSSTLVARSTILPQAAPEPKATEAPCEPDPSLQRSQPAPQSGLLPIYLTRFFGRDEDLTLLTERLSAGTAPSQNRLMTLTGSGGVGKTRLALAAAERVRSAFADRVWFVPLADLADPRLIADAIASSLRLPRTPHLDGMQQVIEALANRPTLLLLDNFEHLAEDGAALVEELLARLPLLICLVTSRRCLGIPGEREVPIAPLPVPETALGVRRWALGKEACGTGGGRSNEITPPLSPLEPHSSAPDPQHPTLNALLAVPSVRLFVDRAQAVRPGFQLTAGNVVDVAALCRELEGIPLAIELAAAQVRVLTPAQMRTRLSQRFELLVNRRAGKDMRHRSMHAVIQSSFHLLSPPLRRLFTQLSVFRGGWTLEAAEVVCCEDAMLDSLDRLCADSLIVAEEIEGEMRFRMLETLREFAAEQLAEPERWAVARRHVVYCIAFANEASRHLKESDEAVWLGRLERELDNLRAAFDACRLDPQGGEPGMRLAHSLHRFWITRGPLREGRQRVAAALEHAGAQEVTPERADALYTLGGLALMQDDYALARDLTEQALELAQQVGHRRGIAQALSNLGSVAYYQADLDRSEVLNRRSLELNREIGNEHGVNVALHNLAIIAEHRYDYRAARALYAQSLALAMQLGNSQGIASAHSNLGNIARRQNEIPEAKTHFAQSLAIQRDLGNKVGIAIALTQMGTVLASERDYEAARAYYVEALSLYREQGIRRGLATALSNLGDLEYEMGRVEEARALQEESLALYRDLNSRDGVVAVLLHLGQTLTRSGDFERSRQCLEECLQLSRPAGHHLFVTESLKALAALAVSQSHWELAAWYYGAAEAGREPLDCPLSPEQQEELAAAYALLCTKLTDQGFSRAFAAGRAAPLNRITMFGPG